MLTSPRILSPIAGLVMVFGLLAVATAQQAASGSQDAGAYVEGVTGHGQPTLETLDEISDAGYGVVIDMRMPNEDRGLEDERAAVEARGMTYIALPIDGGAGVTYENASKLDEILAGVDGPAFVHCGSGNRAGAVLALRAKLNGADNETAVEAGKRTGLTRLEDVVRQRLEER
jgi:uncharacterized protein (TIGR01244 family)